MYRPKFVIERSSGGQFYWRLVAGNGETVGVGEMHTRPEDAKRGAKSARRAALLAKIEE
jgi:uncharacterized protein YegP (UPF0339 family)